MVKMKSCCNQIYFTMVHTCIYHQCHQLTANQRNNLHDIGWLVISTVGYCAVLKYGYDTKFVAGNCQDGDIRLSDGEAVYEGRVEVCFNGVWGTLSRIGWSSKESMVVCRQLGYKFDGMSNEYMLWCFDIVKRFYFSSSTRQQLALSISLQVLLPLSLLLLPLFLLLLPLSLLLLPLSSWLHTIWTWKWTGMAEQCAVFWTWEQTLGLFIPHQHWLQQPWIWCGNIVQPMLVTLTLDDVALLPGPPSFPAIYYSRQTSDLSEKSHWEVKGQTWFIARKGRAWDWG